ncbi:hypothetical protein GPECTOR_10g1142 [Gonium pectorale]|uniref:Uncharacterized protein n=1 Tax=Gonium pectorale TaxID=33097 RepID=A0A150GQK3_GONPE|nr:hypothetical protein GPECTOR_10g1142 [Gonium pectorale]|eukprot:KXZ52119.1 hypothetical protein GPECTOR_10g1142 [Gonium pectorale]
MAGETPPHSRVWLPELVERFARFLPPNVVACALRLVDKATSAQFRGRPQFATVRLSHPVPPWAFAARWAAPGAMTHLTLAQRHQLLCLTAASGVVTNLQLALRLAGCVQAPDHEAELLCAAANAGRLDACQLIGSLTPPISDEQAKQGLPVRNNYFPRTANYNPVVVIYELAPSEQLPEPVGIATVSVPGGNAVRLPVFRAGSFVPALPPQQNAAGGMSQ